MWFTESEIREAMTMLKNGNFTSVDEAMEYLKKKNEDDRKIRKEEEEKTRDRIKENVPNAGSDISSNNIITFFTTPDMYNTIAISDVEDIYYGQTLWEEYEKMDDYYFTAKKTDNCDYIRVEVGPRYGGYDEFENVCFLDPIHFIPIYRRMMYCERNYTDDDEIFGEKFMKLYPSYFANDSQIPPLIGIHRET